MTYQLHITVARGFWERFRGLMLSSPLPADQALLIPRCTSIHTFFMRYSLDLAYLDKDGHVVKLVRSVKPWRMSRAGSRAEQVIEMTAGGIDRHEIKMGDTIDVSQGQEKLYAT